MEQKVSGVTRRKLLAAGAALPLCGIISRRAAAARPKYRFKFAGNLPMSHPINVRVKEKRAFDAIPGFTGGIFVG